MPNGLARPAAGGGKTNRLVVSYETPRDQFAPVSFEEALNRQLMGRSEGGGERTVGCRFGQLPSINQTFASSKLTAVSRVELAETPLCSARGT